ncbi:unnamed protein product [marine sediment metagenome]|uniref:Uncharacterized protein n=1 Tax=marine sediment metagenome TaxID=412755 RepID=X1FJX8_9ZZZZ
MEIKMADIVAVIALVLFAVLFFYEKIPLEVLMLVVVAVLAYFGITVTLQRFRHRL